MTQADPRRRWLLALLAALLLHNAEEALALTLMPGALVNALASTGLHLPVPPTPRILAGLLLFTLVPAVVIGRTAGQATPVRLFLCCMMATMMGANAIVPHLVLTVLTRGYTPGAATALTVTLPIATGLLVTAWRQGWIARRLLFAAGALGIALLPLVLTGFWALGELAGKFAK